MVYSCFSKVMGSLRIPDLSSGQEDVSSMLRELTAPGAL